LQLKRHILLLSLPIGLAGCSLTAAAPPVPPAEFLLLNGTAPRSARAWRPGRETPPAAQSDKGVILPCPFASRSADRFYWDFPLRRNLTGVTSLELDLSCRHPEALRAVSIYFKSGAGWYAWTGDLPPHHGFLLVPRAEFTREGRPAGWNRIEAVRIAAWKGAALDASLTLTTLSARRDALLIVRPGPSCPQRDRSVAARAARRISTWLRQSAVPHGIIEESAVPTRIGPARLLILPYNPNPSATMRSALHAFLDSGGRLLVVYCADSKLAGLMHFRLGRYHRAPRPGTWSRIVFARPHAWHVPDLIVQQSWNIRPAYPADRQAAVVAWWHDARGRRTRYPAVVASPAGIWISHILLADDPSAKRRMLLALVMHLLPQTVERAARAALRGAGAIDSFRSFEETAAALRKTTPSSRRGRVESLVKTSARLLKKAGDSYHTANYVETIDTVHLLNENLTKAYALAQEPRPHEFRGVWDRRGIGIYPGRWNRTCAELSACGINSILANFAGGGCAHYASRVLPPSDIYRRYGDQLRQCTRAAERNGLAVHVWKICFNLEGAPPSFIKRMAAEGRLELDAHGRPLPWLSPAHPANRRLELETIAEIAARGGIAGIQLDYIRFPEQTGAFTPFTRRWFRKQVILNRGTPLGVAPDAFTQAALTTWKCRVIEDLVSRVRALLKKTSPDLQLSAAVFGDYPDAALSVGQDWASWLRRGLVDFVCPMNYVPNSARFQELLTRQIALAGPRRIIPGIGVTAAECQLSPDRVLEQIAVLRNLNSAGFVLYSLDPTFPSRLLPLIRPALVTDPADGNPARTAKR